MIILDSLAMEPCKVGLFELPGLKFNQTLETELIEQMKSWSEQNKCGTYMTNYLWSFRNEHQRDWFILRWADELARLQQ